MQWEQSLYRITLRSNPTTVAGQINIRLKDEELAGLLWMADLLFGSALNTYLTVQIWTGRRPVAYVQNGRVIGQVPDLIEMYPSYWQIFVLADIPLILDPKPNELWSDYLLTLERASGHIFNTPIMPYHVRLINRRANRTLIVQFMTQQFLRGVLRCLPWFKMDPNEYIDFIGIDDAVLTFNEVD